MAENKPAKKTVELWEGANFELDVAISRDFEFQKSLLKAQKEQDMGEVVALYMDIIGGDEAYEKIREHIKSEHDGIFDTDALLEILRKIDDFFPKAGNRQFRRSN